ncbi:MAG: prephenate dehydrogenase [Peptococcaceae bacterium]|nr:prephenate dehydrogenase [Peptococcaceae bacterium]
MRTEPLFGKAAVVGVGLIGGSLGMAIRSRSLAGEVIGIGRSPEALQAALDHGAVDRVSLSYGDLSGCDLVIVAVPVGSTAGVLRQMSPHLTPGVLVTDVGSTKVRIVEESRSVLPQGAVFIGGHPMAGSEKEGVAGADPYLFENAFYVITPGPETPEDSLRKLIGMVEGIGAKPVLMDPVDHDLSVAAVSHLPHLVAATLVNCLFDFPGSGKMSLLAAGGFRDTTRIAAGNPGMWRDIFMTNREFILKALSAFSKRLDEFREAVESGDDLKIYHLLDRARTLKAGMPARTRGYLPALWEIVVTVPDRPGIIGLMAGILGNAGINISDIEILRVREGEGGTIRLAFATGEEQDRAAALLNESGIPARKRGN